MTTVEENNSELVNQEDVSDNTKKAIQLLGKMIHNIFADRKDRKLLFCNFSTILEY